MTATAANSTADGGVVINVDMNVSDAEKELARLKRRVFKLEDDIEGKEYERNALVQKRRDLERELTALKKERQSTVVDGEFSDNSAVDSKIAEIKKEISVIESQIDKVDQAIEKGNISLDQTKHRYVEIAQKARELNAETKKGADLARADEAANRRAHFEEQQGRIAEQLQSKLRATEELASHASSSIKEKLSPVFEPVYQRMAPTLDRIKQKIYDALDLEEAKKGFLTGIKGIYDALDLGEFKRGILTGAKGIAGGISNLFGKIGPTTKNVLNSVKTGVSGFFSAFKALSPKIAIAVTAVKSAISVLKKAWDIAVKFASGFANALKRGAAAVYNFGSAVAKNFVASMKAIGKFAGFLTKSFSGIIKNITKLSKKFNVFSRAADALGGVFKRLGSTIKQALVFSVIYQGLSMVRQQMGAYLMANEQFSTALRRMQGVLLTAFQPIYDVVLPALTSLISALASAIATVTQFFASFFGTTAKKAQSNAKALYGQAKALEATGEAAKDAEKAFLSFDEIEVLGNKKDDTGGGGGGVSAETGPLFDFEYEESKFDSWGEAFSAFLDKLLDGIPKLLEKFKEFADWLNDLTKNLYEMFTFPGVLEKVKQLGEELARAFEYLADSINWEQLGRALGAGLNLAIAFLNGFIYGGDSADDSQWKRLGKHLADAINGLVDEVQWYEFGRLLWGGFKIGLETLAGILENLNMPALANAASNIIMGFFDEMENTINRISWSKIGTQIATFLNEFRWYEALTSVFTAISAGIMGLKALVDSFLANLKWPEITDQISRAINEAIGLVSWEGVGETIGNCFKTAFDFAKALISKIQWYEIGQSIADFILGFDFVGALGSLADLIAEGINAAIKLAQGFLDKILPEVQGIAEGIADRLRQAVSSVKWDELGGVIGDGIKAALSFVAGLLDPDLFYEVGKAIGDFLVGLNWVEIVGGLTEVLADGIASAVAAVKGFLDSVKPHLKETAEGIAQKINEFVEKVDWKELGETIHDGIEAALDFLLTILDNLNWDEIGDAVVDFLSGLNWGELLEKWGKVVGKAIGGALKGVDLSDALSLGADIVGGMIKGMLNKWDESGGIGGWIKRKLFSPFINGFMSLFGIASPSKVMQEQGEFLIEGLLKGIKDTWDSIVDFFKEKFEPLKENFEKAWEEIKATASEEWESIKETLGTAWDSIKETAKTKFDEVSKKVGDAWNSIKKDAPSKWEEIKETLATAWGKIETTAGEKFGEIKDKIVNKMEEIKDKDWYKTGKSVVDSILSGLESIWNSLSSWASKVKEKIADAFSGANRGGGFGVNTSVGSFGGARMAMASVPPIEEINIPRLAQGAVIPPNREFLAVLGDQRTGTNIEAPLSDIENAVVRAVTAAGLAGGNRNHTTILEINKRELGRVVYQLNNEETQRVGVRLTEVKS